MSVDLSDPEIATIRGELLDPSSATSWFLLHYNPSSTTPALSVVASGPKPVISQWKEHLARLQKDGDAVVFGYGEFEGKGCVLLCLSDSVAGVKRATCHERQLTMVARAVVHSRAVAQLFPDYSALITISKIDELSDSLINERLGLDYYQQRAAPVNNSSSSQPAPANDHTPPPPAPKDREDLPAVPPAMILGETLPLVHSSATNIPSAQSAESTPIAPGPVAPIHAAPTPQHIATSHSIAPATPQASGSTAFQRTPETGTFRQNRQVSGTGHDNTLPEPPADRQRKTSLTARLGKAFGNPPMQNRPSDHSSDGSPTSASGSSRIKSSFSKAFRRTSGDKSPQHSPRTDSHDGPPVPPKDGYPTRPNAQNGEGSTSGAYRTPSGGMGYAPPIVYVAPKDADSSSAPGSFPEAVSKLYPPPNGESSLSPSPSAKRIMTEARIKSVTQEEEIQNRFRRGLHLDDKSAGQREEVNDLDDDVGLPYDTSDHSVSDHLKNHELEESTIGQKDTTAIMQIPRKPVDYGLGDADQNEINGVIPSDPIQRVDNPMATISRAPEEQTVTATNPDDTNADHTTLPMDPDPVGIEEDISARLRDEQRYQSDEKTRLTGHDGVAEALHQQQAEELSREVEPQRLRQQEEQARLEIEARQKADAAAELQRHAEEFAIQKEAERLREQENQERLDAEARRVQEELERQRKDEEEEKLRLALEEQHRMDQIRLAEEETRRREEELKRIEAEKREAERARKQGIKQALTEGKQRGGVMLRGHVTVQTMKSPTWRRRLFRLLSGEMQLFKNEADEKPIQTIPLSAGVSVEHTYEESQVQGSWKIVSGSETFFVFADSPEEKETILEGLDIALS